MSFFQTNINFGSDNGFLAVETEFISDHDFILRVMEIRQKKTKLDFKIVHQEKGNEESLIKLSAGKPIILLISGKGVLNKKIHLKNEEIGPQDILPNSNPEEFYWQYHSVGDYAFASLCRKQKPDELLCLLRQSHAVTGEVFIGTGVLHLAGNIFTENILHLPKSDLVFEKNILQEIKAAANEEKIVKTDGKDIPSSFVPLLCASVFFASKQKMNSSVNSEDYNYFRSEWKQKNLFQKAGALVLLGFLLILFGNYLAYSHYSKRYELLQEEVAYRQSEIDLLNSLQQELSDKQNLLGGTGLNSGYKVSVLSDKIGKTVPSTVQLTEMNIQPLEKGKLKKEDKAAFVSDKIILRGKIFKSTDINSWIKKIKEEKIVKDVVVAHYNQSLNENYAEFELNIHLN